MEFSSKTVTFPCFKILLCLFFVSPAWAQAVAALMIIGLILLIIAFIIAVVSMCNIDVGCMYGTATVLAIVGKLAHVLCNG